MQVEQKVAKQHTPLEPRQTSLEAIHRGAALTHFRQVVQRGVMYSVPTEFVPSLKLQQVQDYLSKPQASLLEPRVKGKRKRREPSPVGLALEDQDEDRDLKFK